MDLERELYPLAHYVNDRVELIDEIFSIIKGAKLKAWSDKNGYSPE